MRFLFIFSLLFLVAGTAQAAEAIPGVASHYRVVEVDDGDRASSPLPRRGAAPSARSSPRLGLSPSATATGLQLGLRASARDHDEVPRRGDAATDGASAAIRGAARGGVASDATRRSARSVLKNTYRIRQ